MKPTIDIGTSSPKTTESANLRKRRSPGPLEKPAVGVEVVIFTVIDADLKVLLVKRSEDPFKGVWSLPGGLVRVRNTGDQGENIDESAQRVIWETIGIKPGTCAIEQLYTFGKAGRDPRSRLISIAWTALIPPTNARSKSLTTTDDRRWFSANEEAPWMLSLIHI